MVKQVFVTKESIGHCPACDDGNLYYFIDITSRLAWVTCDQRLCQNTYTVFSREDVLEDGDVIDVRRVTVKQHFPLPSPCDQPFETDEVIAFIRTGAGPIPLKHEVIHSPTGFEFGYGGSGPADLAFSILRACLSGVQDATALLHDFKASRVSPERGDEFTIKVGDVRAWAAMRAQGKERVR